MISLKLNSAKQGESISSTAQSHVNECFIGEMSTINAESLLYNGSPVHYIVLIYKMVNYKIHC